MLEPESLLLEFERNSGVMDANTVALALIQQWVGEKMKAKSKQLLNSIERRVVG